MAIDFVAKGWFPRKWKKGRDYLEIYIKRFHSLNRKALDETVEYSIQRLKKAFPNFNIEIKYVRTLFTKSIEVKGTSLQSEQSVFWIKFTSKKIYANIYGLDPDSVMNCLV